MIIIVIIIMIVIMIVITAKIKYLIHMKLIKKLYLMKLYNNI